MQGRGGIGQQSSSVRLKRGIGYTVAVIFQDRRLGIRETIEIGADRRNVVLGQIIRVAAVQTIAGATAANAPVSSLLLPGGEVRDQPALA